MAAMMCQVLPQFYRDFNDKTIFISVSVKEYKPYILNKNTPLLLIMTTFVH